MSEGPYSNDPTTPMAPMAGDDGRLSPEGGPTGAGDANSQTSAESSPASRRATAPRIVWVLAGFIVIAVPTAVGLATLISPPGPAAAPSESASLAELSTTAPSRVRGGEDVTRPQWVRPDWADAVPGLTAFELTAGSDVSFANGRLRPTLGISCLDGQTDVHVTTGGTAPIDPETSGHVVQLAFDEQSPQRQRWVAAQDQRALFALEPLVVAGGIATARELRFGFTHYMSGPVVVEFDLSGAGDMITAMSEPCGWTD